MVREGYLKNGPKSREGRGSEKFVRVSWDKALDLVASEMKRVYGEYGPSAVFGRSYGWMSTGKVNASINLQQRLLNFCGGFIGCENSYSTAAISKILPYVVGSGDPRSTSWDVVIEHADRVVFWGADPIVTNDIHDASQRYGLRSSPQSQRHEDLFDQSGCHRHGRIPWIRMDCAPSGHGLRHDARHDSGTREIRQSRYGFP